MVSAYKKDYVFSAEVHSYKTRFSAYELCSNQYGLAGSMAADA